MLLANSGDSDQTPHYALFAYVPLLGFPDNNGFSFSSAPTYGINSVVSSYGMQAQQGAK